MRSMLFVPANREDRMHKALRSGADGVIFDLEGAVPRPELPEAREMVRRVIEASGPDDPAIFVRVGDARSGDRIRADMQAALAPKLHGILLPQTAGVADVIVADRLLDELEPVAGVESGTTVLVPLMETANSIRTSYEIAVSTPRIAYMGAGVSRSGDIARSIGYRHTDEGLETLYLREKVLIDMRSAGIAYPVSGLWSIIDDLDGLRQFANFTRNLGYEGMSAIHPKHIPIINEVFTPTAEEIAHWQDVIDTLAKAHAEGLGAVRYEGGLIDEAHVLTAEQGLAFARKLGLIS
jgi:citrate lyase subunit beta/citryl-CoA lyase